MTDSTHLSLPYLDAAQSQKHVTHNDALQILDALTQLSAAARDVNVPPGSPVEGARYIVGAAATGAFAGHAAAVATWQDGAWRFLTPRAGWFAYVEAENLLRLFDGTIWRDASDAAHAFGNLDRLGLGAAADAANPLSAKLNAALFTAKSPGEGGSGDLRFNLNKSAVGNVVSQLYEDNYSGRAETGLIGDDHFRVKVSADGSTWRQALDVDPASGQVSFPSGVGAGAPAPFRNRLRNAAFAINQRAVSGTVSLGAGVYGHDGVRAGAGGCAYTFTTSALDTTLAISSGSLILPIEAALVEGGAYILSQGGAASARVWQGTGFSGSGAYAPVPATGLAVAGLAANTQTNVEFSTGTLLRPQFEPGAVATGFERRPPGVELVLCQRYFETSSYALLSAVQGASGQTLYATLSFAVEKRVAPTLALTTAIQNGFGGGIGVNNSNVRSFTWQAGCTFTGAATLYHIISWTASAEL